MEQPEIMRMNLVGMEPALRQRIMEIAGMAIRTFDGDPSNVTAFNEARDLWAMIEDIEAGL